MRRTAFQPPVQMTTKISLQSWANQSIQKLKQSETPALDVQVVMAFALGQSREWLVTHFNDLLTEEQLSILNSLMQRLQNGEPVAYITGKRSFYGLDFFVSPDVLIPRPETELLVEEAISWLEAHPTRRTAVDVGTGSGILAITLTDRFPDLQMVAVDISQPALEIAEKNAIYNHLEGRIEWLKNDLLSDLSKKVDLIVANLPYIPTDTLKSLDVSRYEPRLALDGGAEGLDLINKMLDQSTEIIRAKGLILLEIEATQEKQATESARKRYPAAKIDCLFDYANFPRIIKILL
jgi:release factor glutamine methyltransferase